MKYHHILILGAAGQIARKLTTKLLLYSDLDIILYGRNVSQRLGLHHSRVTLVDGLFSEAAKLSELVSKVDLVYINAMEKPEDILLNEFYVLYFLNQSQGQSLTVSDLSKKLV